MPTDVLEPPALDVPPGPAEAARQPSATAPDAVAPTGVPIEYESILDRLSATLPHAAITSTRLRSDQFIGQVGDFRRRLRERERGPEMTGFPDICDDFLVRTRAYLREREDEYLELIEIMRDTMTRVTGESATFHDDLVQASARMNAFAELDDIRQIKERIARESSRLQQATEEQKRQMERTLASLTRRVETLEASLDEAEAAAQTDPLTQVANRGRFDRTLARWFQTFESTGEPFVLAMADIDHFKSINDTHGHPIGDRVLVCTAQWLSASIRGTDLLARYGGEEFAILFSSVTLAQAESRLADVCQGLSVRQFTYQHEGETRAVTFTLSAGLAECSPGDTADVLVRRADDSLYAAKRKGRNRVVARKKSRLATLFR